MIIIGLGMSNLRNVMPIIYIFLNEESVPLYFFKMINTFKKAFSFISLGHRTSLGKCKNGDVKVSYYTTDLERFEGGLEFVKNKRYLLMNNVWYIYEPYGGYKTLPDTSSF